MEKRKLGNSELYINPVGLGCMGFSHASGDPTEKDVAVRTLREAYEIGYDFFDTAESYTGINPDGTISYNEELVGEAVKGIRDKVVIATKMGVSHNTDRSLKLDSSPETIRRSVEDSLKKLGTDYIDLYYQHRIDPKVEPETVAKTMAELIKEGKIRYWGISEATEEYLEEHFQGSGQKEYASRLMGAVLGNLEEIDKKLSIYSKRKSIKRMAKVDLAIARLGAGEILYMEDIPGAVAINEAVDMAKKYSADESRKFINGLLGQIMRPNGLILSG